MKHLKTSDLYEITRETMIENGFFVKFSPEIFEEIAELDNRQSVSADASVRDLRSLLWSSIDNETSLDLDQLEYAEQLSNGDVKILIAIADVDEYARKDSAIDRFAKQNTITVYTESKVFPMLPEELSTDLTSLREAVERLAVVVEMTVCENGDVCDADVYRACVYNYAKLSYEEVGAWLDNNAAPPADFAKIEGLERQITLQRKAAECLYALRRKKGALEFTTIESETVKSGDEIVDLQSVLPNSAQLIIENFMIAVNVQTAEFLESKNVASIRRVVKTPARWNRIREIAGKFGADLPEEPSAPALSAFLEQRRAADVAHFPDLSLSIIKLLGAGEYVVQSADNDTDGHFGLAVRDYAHSTAPNRRFADLIVQRLIKAVLQDEPAPYTIEELEKIAAHCNTRESAARKVERKMRKVVAANVMQNRIGDRFAAIVTGVTASGTFARILRPPVDGRIVRGEENLQIGEKINVRLIATDAENGFIDFALD